MSRFHAVYLHGFASSERSSKARFFAERLSAHGIALRCPDFNEPDFSTLTVSRMLRRVDDLVGMLEPGPVTLIGSSLGAFVALHAAAAGHAAPDRGPVTHPIDRMILLAPALDFSLKDDRAIGPEKLAEWRRTNRLEIYHYGYGETRTIEFGLYEDAQRYDAFALDVRVPVLIFQGTRDETVNPAHVQRFARGRPNVTLRLVDDGHQLLESLDRIWRESAEFLELRRLSSIVRRD